MLHNLSKSCLYSCAKSFQVYILYLRHNKLLLIYKKHPILSSSNNPNYASTYPLLRVVYIEISLNSSLPYRWDDNDAAARKG